MKKIFVLIPALLIFLALPLAQRAWAQDEAEYAESYDQAQHDLLAPEEMDNLVAPIALYPDPLIAQILPAATFIDQIDEAARYVRQYGSGARIDEMPWDVSVKAVAHYPDVLNMMDQKYDWTVSLGQAYLDQPQEVMDAIQRLRADAEAEGNLYSTPQQEVVVGTDDIAIEPANPQYIYVPVYDPQVVYVEPYDPLFPFITFSTGFVIGAWLNRDCDWHRHRVYYHGWRGRGWIARSRPHIHDRRGVYINRNAQVVRTNDRIRYSDTRRFRQELRADTTRRLERQRVPAGAAPAKRTRPETRPNAAPQRRPATEGPSSRVAPAAPTPGAATRASQPRQAPATTSGSATRSTTGATSTRSTTTGTTSTGATTTTAPTLSAPSRATTRDVYRGRDVQRSQPASQERYGGYGTGRDATIYRQRGQSSREIMRQSAPRAPAPTVSPRVMTPAPSRVTTPAPSFSRPSAAPMQRSAPMPSAPRSAPSMPRSAPSAAPGGMQRR